MTEKKYYWLKLKADFFNQKEIKKLRKIAGGDTYTIIYLKMQLKSLDSGGKLYYEGFEDDFASELALDLDEDPDNVKITIIYLEKHNLIEKSFDDNMEQYSIAAVDTSTGAETAVASRVRHHRDKQKMLQCNTHVTKCNTELELELELELEKENIKQVSLAHGNKLPLIDYLAIIESYNEAFKNSSAPQARTSKIAPHRSRAIKTRCKDEFKTLREWQEYFWWASQQHFLREECRGMGIDFLLKPANISKVLEGVYLGVSYEDRENWPEKFQNDYKEKFE